MRERAGTSVPRPELISSPCIASFVDGEAIQVSPSPAGNARTLRNRAGHTHTHIYSTSSPCKKVSMLDGIGHLPPIKTGGADIDGQWKLWPFAAWKIEMTPQLAASARAHVVTLGVAGAFGVHQEESEV